MFIPNPIRCRKCLKFGHFADKCTKSPICPFCAKPEHNGTPCETIVPNCTNCGNHYSSLDVKCPKMIEEKEIKTIQFKEKIPYNEAKRKYKQSHPSVGKLNYAEAARGHRKVGMIDVGIQTSDFISTENITSPSSSKGISIQTDDNLTPPSTSPPSLPSLPLPPSLTSPPIIPSLSLPPHPIPQQTSPPPVGENNVSPQNTLSDKDTSKCLNHERKLETPPLARSGPLSKPQRTYSKKNKERPKSDDQMDTI